MRILIQIILAGTIAASFMAGSALAKQKRAYKTITVRGEWNTQIVVKAPIRQTDIGKQARLPNGTWIWCEGDCAEAIRHQYIDYWERQRELTSHIHP